MSTMQTIHVRYVHSFSRDFVLEFRVGVANVQSREGVGVGDGIVRKSAGEFL